MYKSSQGFTLLEIIVVITIIATLSLGGWMSFSKFRNSKALQNTVSAVTSVLNDARGKTLAGEGSNQYGVYFDSDRIVLFIGPTYTEGLGTNQEFSFESPVVLGTVSLNAGGSSVLFDKQTGATSNYGSVEIEIPSGDAKIVTIEGTGVISID